MSRILCLSLAVVLLAGLCWPSSGFAQPPERSAQELSEGEKRELASLMQAGRAAYDSGEFERSLRYFRDAYEIYAHPNLLYRIALAYEKLGDDAEAARHYRLFLEEKPDTDKRRRIEKTLAVLEERVAQQASHIRIKTKPSQATVYINDKVNGVAGTTPLELPISAGNYKLIIEKNGYERVEEAVDIPEGQTLVVSYDLSEKPSGGDQRASEFPTGPVVLGVVGLAAGAGAIYSWGEYTDTRAQIERWDALKEQGEPRPAGYNRYHDDMEFYGVMTWVSAGAAVASLAGATIWWLQDDDDDRALAISPSLAAGASGYAIDLKLDF